MKNLLFASIVMTISVLVSADVSAQRPDQDRPAGERRTGGQDRPGQQRDFRRGDRNARGPGNQDFVKQMFQRLDQDQDGVIQLSDVPQQARQRLARMDANQDGKLKLTEAEQAFQRLAGSQGRPGRGERGPGMPGPRGMRPGAGGMNGMPDQAAMFNMFLARLDKDGDKAISLQEAPERMKPRFDRMDQNGDEKIDLEEWKMAAERMADQMRGGRRGDSGEATKPQRPKRPPAIDKRGN